MNNQVQRAQNILADVQAQVMCQKMYWYVSPDPYNPGIAWVAPATVTVDSVTGSQAEFVGARHVVDATMTDDEVVRVFYKSYRQYLDHEAMEGFKYKNVSVFSPHYSLASLAGLWKE